MTRDELAGFCREWQAAWAVRDTRAYDFMSLLVQVGVLEAGPA
jgi:hypothetical protein